MNKSTTTVFDNYRDYLSDNYRACLSNNYRDCLSDNYRDCLSDKCRDSFSDNYCDCLSDNYPDCLSNNYRDCFSTNYLCRFSHLMFKVEGFISEPLSYVSRGQKQIHCWDNAVPLKETLTALNDLVRCGKVRYVGGSNLTGWQLQKITDLSREMGFTQFISLQQQYNLLTRENEFEVVDVCENEGIGVIPWSPLKGGLLTGKYKRGEKAGEDTRMGWNEKKNIVPEYQKLMASDRFWDLAKVLEDIAKETGKTVAQVSLRWLLQKKSVPSVIIGATKISQLEDNVGASTGWTLTDPQMKRLDEASAPDTPYPYNFIARINSDRINKSKI